MRKRFDSCWRNYRKKRMIAGFFSSHALFCIDFELQILTDTNV
nr:MAG TPA: hypothetical protein [Caudoviricetes sp.]